MTNTDGLTFPQWLDQVDKLLYSRIKMNHADFDCDYEWQWGENNQPALWMVEDIIQRAMPESFRHIWGE